jgi:hypothetical protein
VWGEGDRNYNYCRIEWFLLETTLIDALKGEMTEGK